MGNRLDRGGEVRLTELIGIGGRGLPGRGGTTSQSDAECEYPAEQMSQVSGHVALFPDFSEWRERKRGSPSREPSLLIGFSPQKAEHLSQFGSRSRPPGRDEALHILMSEEKINPLTRPAPSLHMQFSCLGFRRPSRRVRRNPGVRRKGRVRSSAVPPPFPPNPRGPPDCRRDGCAVS